MIGSDPIFSVGEFVAVYNQSIEMLYPRVGIVGELSSLRLSRGHWLYFDLKDDHGQVKFFGTVRDLPGPLEDGMQLEVYGRPRLHPKYGFSIVVETIRVSGEGSIKKAQDLLASKLQKEGLFEDDRKRTLPYAPGRVGLITADGSAALSDFRKIIDERWGNTKIELRDVLVQGDQSSAQIVQAIHAFNEQSDPPELIVLIRGGGSAEDLASFNNEAVVRAIAGSRLPTLVAIGHEIDVSLAELAADLRASTPSNAAEILMPDRTHEKHLVEAYRTRLNEKVNNILDKAQNERETVREYLESDQKYRLQEMVAWQENTASLLALLDPDKPLARGYAIVRSNRQLIRSKNQVNVDDLLMIQLSDGTIKGKVSK